MTDRPILFSAPMVNAILAGRKTQTRRDIAKSMPWSDLSILQSATAEDLMPYVRWKVGDRLWIREAWGHDWFDDGQSRAWKRVVYRADPGAQALDNGSPAPWKSSMFMPRAASRLTLTVTDVEVERLQGISEKDAEAEGCVEDFADGMPVWYVPGAGLPHTATGAECYRNLWNSINGPGAWERNPVVTVIRFKVERRNPDHPITEGPFHVEA